MPVQAAASEGHFPCGCGEPHHCGFVNKPMGEAQLRIDCADYVAGSAVEQAQRWQEFVRGSEGHEALFHDHQSFREEGR